MGKSLTATLVGRLMNDGHFGLDDPAPVPEWQTAGDPRAKIRISDMLRMSSGLQFTLHEVLDQTPEGPKVVRDCYPDHYYVYSGAMDIFRYVTSRPAEYEPNTVGRYRNVDPLTLGYIVKRTVEARGESYLTYPQRGAVRRDRHTAAHPRARPVRQLHLLRLRAGHGARLGPAGTTYT